jgi:hypothetical protein
MGAGLDGVISPLAQNNCRCAQSTYHYNSTFPSFVGVEERNEGWPPTSPVETPSLHTCKYVQSLIQYCFLEFVIVQ